jgi:hypothetical protein
MYIIVGREDIVSWKNSLYCGTVKWFAGCLIAFTNSIYIDKVDFLGM